MDLGWLFNTECDVLQINTCLHTYTFKELKRITNILKLYQIFGIFMKALSTNTIPLIYSSEYVDVCVRRTFHEKSPFFPVHSMFNCLPCPTPKHAVRLQRSKPVPKLSNTPQNQTRLSPTFRFIMMDEERVQWCVLVSGAFTHEWACALSFRASGELARCCERN